MSTREPIVVVGADGPEVKAIAAKLDACGFCVEHVPTLALACALERELPLVCWHAGGDSAALRAAVMAFRADTRAAASQLVLLADPATVPEHLALLELGADELVSLAAPEAELSARLHARHRAGRALGVLQRHRSGALMVLELTQALSSALHIRDILLLVVRRMAELVKVDRVSIVLTGDGGEQGYVLVASDDATLRDLPIRLADYPEINEVLRSGNPLMIADSAAHPLFELAHTDVPKRFRSLTLLPLVFEDRPMGVLFLRHQQPRVFDEGELTLLRAVANATAIALRNARLVQSLRDESRRSRTAHVEAQRRVESLERYADFFDSSADGILILDASGGVLFCNPAASRVTGRSVDELRRGRFEGMLSANEEKRFAELRDSFGRGAFPSNLDLELRTPAGETRLVNVAFNNILREQGSVIVSLRDVTEDRMLAREHARTKEFLQQVIDSSVDAIVSADMRGLVLLFNPAAERIYGHHASEVVGRMNVRDLYPPGEALVIMRHLRNADRKEPSRVQGYQTEALGKDGSIIPVLLSAALIMQHGKPMGSVGVFTDLRAKLQIEERLAQTQQELAVQERKAVIAELAGATAHELNQPLTAIMGYAELLTLRLEESSPLLQASSAIVREADRMADIVRKIGKLTKYETKPYVGEAKIIDLDRAVESEPGRQVR